MCGLRLCRVAGAYCSRRKALVTATNESKPWTWQPAKLRTSHRARPRAIALAGICSSMDANEGTLWAAPFDAKNLELTGAACWVPVAGGVMQNQFYERECQGRAPPRLSAKPCWAWHSASAWLE